HSMSALRPLLAAAAGEALPEAGAGAAAGAGADEGAAAGDAAAAGFASAGFAPAAAAASTIATTLPWPTRSPTFTLISRTVPAALAGTSMVALSDSRVTSP